MLRTVAISTLLFVGAVSVAQADVFRWVDEHGGVHYSDQWVPGSQVIKSNRPHPPSDSPPAADTAPHAASPQKTADGASAPADPNASKAMKQDMAKVREQQCKDAKDRYDKAIQARRIYKSKQGGGQAKDTDPPDDREYLSDEEADSYRVKARQEMQNICGSAAK
jgi:hypothetical protein